MSGTRDDILEAAVELFCEKGFRGTTIRDICGRAGANVAAVNYHFKGKSGLGEAVVDYLFEPLAESGLEDLGLDSIRSEEEWRSGLVGFIYGFIVEEGDESSRRVSRSRLVFRELDAPSELFPIMFRKYMRPLQSRLMSLVRVGLPPDAPEDEAELWFMTIISQCVMFRKKPIAETGVSGFDLSDKAVARRVAEHIAETVFSGLRYHGVGKDVKR
jgi:AcrR family transcriptional regulator